MDLWSSLKPVVASTMTLQHHLGFVLRSTPKTPKSTPDLQRRITVKVDPHDIHMLIHIISRYQNILYTFAMDVGSSLKPVVVSRMTLQHHLGSELPPKEPQNPPLNLQRRITVGVDPMCSYTAYQGSKTLYVHLIWIRDQEPVVASTMTFWHHLGSGLPVSPQNPKIHPRPIKEA